jgi:hypothetical protein
VPFYRTVHIDLSPAEVADRLALRELIDAYAHCADRRAQTFNGRDRLRPLLENLNTYETTTHFNGQTTVQWGSDSASDVLHCLAHLVKVEGT